MVTPVFDPGFPSESNLPDSPQELRMRVAELNEN